MIKIGKQEALDYHQNGRKGKIEVIPSKPYSSQRDLSLAYSPGVAEPVKAIFDNPEDAYKYTVKGNLVAVITNGTAVLGLGNMGPLAAKPVMEGKGLLFKIFADIDVFDIEMDASDPEKFIEAVKAISPTFGAINLEDIKAPEAFIIEERLKAELNIPVMHDDQHGTAIISGAALVNALEIANKKIEDVKIVIIGAGAAAISCARLYLSLGASPGNMVMTDSKGVIRSDRSDPDEMKKQFATDRDLHSISDALKDADVMLGLSKANIVSKEMIASMAKNPIVFALANPDPEISYEDAISVRKDIIMATGRSDHPNQVNNVLGFPYIFRGALDVMATTINEEMKLAAVRAIADLAKEIVPEQVNEAYDMKNMSFGRELIIPKPLDPRLITRVSAAVAKAAMESGVARKEIKDWEEYKRLLNERMGMGNELISNLAQRAKKNPQRVVFAEADNYKVLKAAQICRDEGFARPILMGNREKINKLMTEYNLELFDLPIIDPRTPEMEEKRFEFARQFFMLRQRKGVSEWEARKLLRDRNYFGAMMVKNGEADALISGITRSYADVIRPALQIIGKEEGINSVAGMYIMMSKKRGPVFFADTTVNMDPSSEQLAEIALIVHEAVKKFKIEPRIAMLSYSNYGSSKTPGALKVKKAVEILHRDYPDLLIDGEIQANFALNNDMMSEIFPFSKLLGKKCNVLIFPNLAAGNIAYKLMQELGDTEAIGPVLLGMKKSVHILQLGSSVREIVNMVRIAVVDAQTKKEND